MKAAVFNRIGEPLEIVDLPEPEPAPGQVILKVGRCGICGTDLHMTEEGGNAPCSGTVIGHEIAGEVVALGKGVSRLKIGDRVAALPISGCGACAACLSGEPVWCQAGMQFLGGGYAQFARAGERECLVLPGDLSDADGALVEPLAVALHGVRMAEGIAGAAVSVFGAGAIGLAVVYWARRFGAGRIEVVEGNLARRELAMAMGANATRAPGPMEAPTGAFGINGGGAQFVFECVGKPGLLAAAISEVRPRGTVISLGFCMAPEQVVAAAAAQREVTLKFPIIYSVQDYQMTIDSLAAGHISPRDMVTGVVGFSDLPATFEALRKPDRHCKVMIDPWA